MNEAKPNELVGQFIPPHYHFQMLREEARMLGFKKAIQALVPPGGNVLELGGGTGVMSFFAANIASKIWCVEYQPTLVSKAKELFTMNPHTAAVEFIQADAFHYLPPEPVDIVICEMLHSALLREKQATVISSFKERYHNHFGHFGKGLPVFIPEATILAVEPVYQDFDFYGYYCPIPLFQSSGSPGTISLGSPAIYSVVTYKREIPVEFDSTLEIPVETEGLCNALRFITSNILAMIPGQAEPINWMNQNLVLPVRAPLDIKTGDTLHISFKYKPGDEIDSILESMTVQKIEK